MSIIIQNVYFYLLFFLKSDAKNLIGYHIFYNFTIFDIKCSQIKWNIWTIKESDEEMEYELVTWKRAWPLKAGVLLSFFFWIRTEPITILALCNRRKLSNAYEGG